MNCSMPNFPVLHYPLEFAQTHAHWIDDAIQPSHPLSPPSLPALSLSQHQDLFQWVGSMHQVAKVLELQLQHQTFQWILKVDSLLLKLNSCLSTLQRHLLIFPSNNSKISSLFSLRKYFLVLTGITWRFPHGSVSKESACNGGDLALTWVGNIPWRRKWQPTPVFVPGKSHGLRSLVGYIPWCHKSWTWLSD